MSELEHLAKLVAIEAPENSQAATAKIPWEIIDRIRVELDIQGFNWRRAVRHRKALEEVRNYERLYDQAIKRRRDVDMSLYASRLDAARERLAQFK
jgi:hypothetical protein